MSCCASQRRGPGRGSVAQQARFMESLTIGKSRIGALYRTRRTFVAYATKFCTSGFAGSWKVATCLRTRLEAMNPGNFPRIQSGSRICFWEFLNALNPWETSGGSWRASTIPESRIGAMNPSPASWTAVASPTRRRFRLRPCVPKRRRVGLAGAVQNLTAPGPVCGEARRAVPGRLRDSPDPIPSLPPVVASGKQCAKYP
jgi:hypothetical protein